MAYDTATPDLVDGQRVRLVYSGPGVPKIEEESFGVTDLEGYARARIAALNTPRAKTNVAVGTALDLTPPAAPALTLQQTYDRDRAKALANDADVRAGITTSAAAHVVAALATAQASLAALLKG